MLKTTSSRLGAALLGYFTVILLLLTLNPFLLTVPGEFRILWTSTREDFLANVLLFLPLGFLYRLTGGKRRHAALLGASISFGIETVQLFMPARTSSLMDFFANAAGAGVGAALFDPIFKRFTIPARAVGQLRLETPLMSLTYLLIPLLWVNGLAVRSSPGRWALTALLGVCGAVVFGELFRQWFGEVRFRRAWYAALTAGVWFLLGAGPRLLRPFPIVLVGLAVMALSGALSLIPLHSKDRRFERSTLIRLLPFFLLYLLLVALWPPWRPLTGWHGMFGFTTRLEDTSLLGLAPRLEYLAAFTVFGYLLAEWRGRDEWPLRRDLPRIAALAGGSALLLEVLIGFQEGLGASLIRGALAVPCALFGGAIYHLLRAHVRFLLRRMASLAGRPTS